MSKKIYLIAGALSLMACGPVLAASHDHHEFGSHRSRDDAQDRTIRDCNKEVNFATGRLTNVCTYEAE